MSLNSGKLWIVATPLGNPGDLSPRAREIVSGADIVLAEDTRRSGILLAACGITAKRFISLHEHNEASRLKTICRELLDGAVAALISDAGTPLVSDPGFLLVRACRDQGVAVSPVPGPSAPIAALSASGLPPTPFAFLGFPPRSKGDIRKFFSPYATLPLTLIFFERKDRVTATLAIAAETLGVREGCIARELTKTYEEFIPFTLGTQEAPLPPDRELLGEITIVIGPPRTIARTPQEEVLLLVADQQAMAPEAKPREIARRVHALASEWSVSDVYALLRHE